MPQTWADILNLNLKEVSVAHLGIDVNILSASATLVQLMGERRIRLLQQLNEQVGAILNQNVLKQMAGSDSYAWNYFLTCDINTMNKDILI